MTPVDPAEETVVVVNEDNVEIGAVRRREMRARRLIHRASYVLVFSRRGELFVHRRTETKDVYPGYWDIAAGGVVLAGESYEECARRELGEELGVRRAPLTRRFDHYFEDRHNRVWGRIFTCTWDGPFQLQPEEVCEGRFFDRSSLAQLVRAEPVTPDGVAILRRLHLLD